MLIIPVINFQDIFQIWKIFLPSEKHFVRSKIFDENRYIFFINHFRISFGINNVSSRKSRNAAVYRITRLFWKLHFFLRNVRGVPESRTNLAWWLTCCCDNIKHWGTSRSVSASSTGASWHPVAKKINFSKS